MTHFPPLVAMIHFWSGATLTMHFGQESYKVLEDRCKDKQKHGHGHIYENYKTYGLAMLHYVSA